MCTMAHADIDDEWANFINNNYDDLTTVTDDYQENYTNNIEYGKNQSNDSITIPKPSDIYISTKTKIAYLNHHIDLNSVFWNIPIIKYTQAINGVVKKQIKINTTSREVYDLIQTKLDDIKYYEQHIISHIDNPDGRITFKDTRKISIGISKKDILSYRSKKKSAFYNCFVLIIRLKVISKFYEYHVKVFNTGKLEIPGVQDNDSFELLLGITLDTLRLHVKIEDGLPPLNYKENTIETVLINSNFNCGFYIDREKLYTILTDKYKIQSIYDPCSYPGIQCKFYFNHDIKEQTGQQISKSNIDIYTNITNVSFMIFRTGSVLIVGKCNESVLSFIYDFVKNILHNEYNNIHQMIYPNTSDDKLRNVHAKKKKIRKKIIVNVL
jgi:hypothetical protein